MLNVRARDCLFDRMRVQAVGRYAVPASFNKKNLALISFSFANGYAPHTAVSLTAKST